MNAKYKIVEVARLAEEGEQIKMTCDNHLAGKHGTILTVRGTIERMQRSWIEGHNFTVVPGEYVVLEVHPIKSVAPSYKLVSTRRRNRKERIYYFVQGIVCGGTWVYAAMKYLDYLHTQGGTP